MEHRSADRPPPRRLAAIAAAALVVVVFFERTVTSWRRWPDVVIDFGRELYAPWRLSQGAVLYRDVAHLSGPVSPLVNALWFRLFGISLTVLAVANLTLLAALVVGLYVALRRVTDLVTAVSGCVTLLVVFAFGHFVHCGNYNFVCPYAHELTHGIVLLAILLAALAGPRRRAADVGAGVCLGLLFLGKPETFAAGAAAMLASLILTERSSTLARIGWIALGTIPPLAACIGIFTYQGSVAEAADALVAAWRPVLAGRSADNDFYRHLTGLDAPGSNLLDLARGVLRGVCLVGGRAAAGRAFRSKTEPLYVVIAVVCAVAASLLRGDDPGLFSLRHDTGRIRGGRRHRRVDSAAGTGREGGVAGRDRRTRSRGEDAAAAARGALRLRAPVAGGRSRCGRLRGIVAGIAAAAWGPRVGSLSRFVSSPASCCCMMSPSGGRSPLVPTRARRIPSATAAI